MRFITNYKNLTPREISELRLRRNLQIQMDRNDISAQDLHLHISRDPGICCTPDVAAFDALHHQLQELDTARNSRAPAQKKSTDADGWNHISSQDLHLHISRDPGICCTPDVARSMRCICYLKLTMQTLDCAFTHSQPLTQLLSIFMTGNHRFTIDEKKARSSKSAGR